MSYNIEDQKFQDLVFELDDIRIKEFLNEDFDDDRKDELKLEIASMFDSLSVKDKMSFINFEQVSFKENLEWIIQKVDHNELLQSLQKLKSQFEIDKEKIIPQYRLETNEYAIKLISEEIRTLNIDDQPQEKNSIPLRLLLLFETGAFNKIREKVNHEHPIDGQRKLAKLIAHLLNEKESTIKRYIPYLGTNTKNRHNPLNSKSYSELESIFNELNIPIGNLKKLK